MAWQKWFPVFLEEWKRFLEKAPDVSPVHKTDHVLRVWETSRKICERLNGDMEVMVAAVLLHDLGRHLGLEIHGEKSAELAKPILEKHGFPDKKTGNVLEAIAQHDYTFPPEKRRLLEAKILYDADKIDAFGHIGVYRHIVLYMEKKKAGTDEILRMLEKRWRGLMLPESRKVAKADYDYIVEFFKALEKQLGMGG